MKKLICAVIAISFLLGLASCSERGTGKSIIYPLSSSPRTIDPQYISDTPAKIIVNNCFEGLVRFNGDGEIIPGIASDWEISDDGLTYTFHMQEGTEWYCPISLKKEYGEDFYNKYATEKVTAKDFVFACRRAIDPETGSSNAYRLMVIENAVDIYSGKIPVDALGVYATDPNTVVFKLSEKCDDFLGRLTESEFMPCNEEFFNSMNGRYGLSTKHILCNGPFYVSFWDPESSMTIKANKCYAGKQTPKPVSVVLSFDSVTESIVKKLDNGTFTGAFLPPDCEVPASTKTVKEINNTVYGFMFNCSDEFLSNANIRKAFCSSIDRSLFAGIEGMDTEEHGIVPGCCICGGVAYRDKVGGSVPEIEHSVEKAKEYWSKGVKNIKAETISVSVLCPQELDGALREQFQIWQGALGINLQISIRNMSANEISSAVSRGEYQIAITGMKTDREDAANYLADINDIGIFRLKSKGYSDIVNRLVTADNDDDVADGCFEAEEYLLKNGVCFPLFSRSAKFVISDDAEGIEILDSESSVCFINARRFD